MKRQITVIIAAGLLLPFCTACNIAVSDGSGSTAEESRQQTSEAQESSASGDENAETGESSTAETDETGSSSEETEPPADAQPVQNYTILAA